MEQNPQAAPQQPKMMILTKDTGKKVLLFLNQIDSISESNYGMTVTTKAGKTYDVTESFNTLIRQLKGA